MFNYSNLDDIELEELCKDVMERMLNIKFRSFRAGVDGGIDLKDYDSENNIIVQVKHYINSTVPMLKSSLKKEVEKVDKLNPNEYYVCCTKELGPNDIKDIYNLFKKYMDSEKNIITLKEIDDLLREERNIDIVRKHYKLWLYSSNILSEINNQNTFIDCETLLSDINNESKYYVRTQAYDIGIDILEKFGSLILAGSPGVGKTTISKMIILYYATLGYRVRYTTNGDIDNIKKSLSVDRELNEIILLDDCLGQYYFKIKESQQRELIDIIKYVNNNKSKKIILNSRITILNQAQKKSQEFENFVINKKVRIHVMDMDNISLVEKARILYNHLYFNNVSKEYYDSIKNNKIIIELSVIEIIIQE
ncbi:restriction endonuclease [Clostridium saccharoperbutylacetonicum]|uniref:nSTAND3 domain-containing NTPase n=1 Tax=Clostridium saccharoperbutylacetonicum TaxID=36745 RepID=UPI0003492476|nr:restriction endonuclease [Clostridium saccharoperbutylacetonicum]